MIVTRGLGTGPYLGAIVAFGLTRESSDSASTYGRNWGHVQRRHKRVRDPFFELESLMEDLEFASYLEEEVLEIVEAHKELETATIDVPETVEEIPEVTQDYTKLYQMLSTAIQNYTREARRNEEALQVIEVLQRARQKLQQEEEEIILLITLEIL